MMTRRFLLSAPRSGLVVVVPVWEAVAVPVATGVPCAGGGAEDIAGALERGGFF